MKRLSFIIILSCSVLFIASCKDPISNEENKESLQVEKVKTVESQNDSNLDAVSLKFEDLSEEEKECVRNWENKELKAGYDYELGKIYIDFEDSTTTFVEAADVVKSYGLEPSWQSGYFTALTVKINNSNIEDYIQQMKQHDRIGDVKSDKNNDGTYTIFFYLPGEVARVSLDEVIAINDRFEDLEIVRDEYYERSTIPSKSVVNTPQMVPDNFEFQWICRLQSDQRIKEVSPAILGRRG